MAEVRFWVRWKESIKLEKRRRDGCVVWLMILDEEIKV